ncbi:MAG TPA: hypothetical protein PLF40_18525, partial [Kofleriaceae bacterium]|nr:hypothetical protein [Kofleriaceae bacterium]
MGRFERRCGAPKASTTALTAASAPASTGAVAAAFASATRSGGVGASGPVALAAGRSTWLEHAATTSVPSMACRMRCAVAAI